MKIEEASSSTDSDDQEELDKKRVQKKQKSEFDLATLLKAKEIAAQNGKAQALQNIPTTASGFEKDFNALKRDLVMLLSYLKQIPLASIESYFKKVDVPFDVLCGILDALKTEVKEVEWVGKFMVSLAKAYNFDMTLMFIEDKETDAIKTIISHLNPKQ